MALVGNLKKICLKLIIGYPHFTSTCPNIANAKNKIGKQREMIGELPLTIPRVVYWRINILISLKIPHDRIWPYFLRFRTLFISLIYNNFWHLISAIVFNYPVFSFFDSIPLTEFSFFNFFTVIVILQQLGSLFTKL